MLNIERIGRGKPVVFLHGFLESSTMWKHFDLANAPFESILIDLPGHGKSSFKKNLNSISDIATAICTALESINVNDFDLIGHSLGGYVAIEIHKILNLKSKLILFHSNFWDDDVEKKANRNRVIKVVNENKTFFLQEAIPNLFLDQFRNKDAVIALINEAKELSTETIVAYSEMMRDRPNQEEYCLLNQQYLHFIQGELDSIVPAQAVKFYENKITNLYILEMCGHMGYVEQPKRSFDLLCKIITN
jgi:pimeloyl-ACP methyl ester carboxylesterase